MPKSLTVVKCFISRRRAERGDENDGGIRAKAEAPNRGRVRDPFRSGGAKYAALGMKGKIKEALSIGLQSGGQELNLFGRAIYIKHLSNSTV